jgi:hypothetical protein
MAVYKLKAELHENSDSWGCLPVGDYRFEGEI